jgi:Cu-Zn family superoxide dismutase
MAVAVFKDGPVEGEAVAEPYRTGVRLRAHFTRLPAGLHGFHIHRAGDLRGEGCAGACDHLHMGSRVVRHGAAPSPGSRIERHSGDLGNVEEGRNYSYYLPDLRACDLWGRALIVHADEDDLGRGDFPDSGTTGHSGARIGCAIFGRVGDCESSTHGSRRRTRKQRL